MPDRQVAVNASSSARVMGVDACKRGWIGMTNDSRAYFAPTIAGLVAAATDDGELAVVAIDIPIGLSPNGPRQADQLVSTLVGRRRASVFATAVREALRASTHAEATAINVRVTGKGISQQVYGLRTKILEVDAWVAVAGLPVIEVHPELCFATMAGRTLAHPKSTWAGHAKRRSILSAVGLEPALDLGSAGENAAVDDVLDAAAAAWTALRHRAGQSISHPSPPERFADGAIAAIWV